jgi:Tfp pilus assembly protein PilO
MTLVTETGGSWHLDKRVPIATIGAIVIQAMALAWMVSSMNSRIEALEVYTNELKATRIRERMAVEEAATVDMRATQAHLDQQLDRLEVKIDRVSERLGVRPPVQ